MNLMKKIVAFSIFAIIFAGITAAFYKTFADDPDKSTYEKRLEDSKTKEPEKITTGDHSKYEELQGEFASPEELIDACLSCHVLAADQIHKTIHWTWVCPKAKDQTIGKSTVINNFCMAMPSNEPRCTSCHTGFGWKDKTFDFTSERNVDCLVCHDQTGTYKKFPTGAGYPVTDTTVFKGNGKTYYPPNYSFIAQNVGRPSRANCGVCHYFGGGGNKVKHGDLDVALNVCDENLDVHMAKDGLDFVCADCHTTVNHRISGRCYATPAGKEKALTLPLGPEESTRIYCEYCHSAAPHKEAKLNDHTDKVACQTCHIPVMAKANPTKMWWDWSKAGKKNEKGKPLVIKEALDEEHEVVTYDGKKGEFKWARNIEPEYYWYNGSISATVVSDKINPEEVVAVNEVHGSYNDTSAKIYPFKVHRGIQPYDKVNSTFVIPKLFGKKGTGAYWAEFDWGKAITAGMNYAGAEYSGEYDFVETKMYWLVSHMVAPKEQSLACEECHTPSDSRLANLTGFYMPGRDTMPILNILGVIGIALTFIAVVVHGGARIFSSNKNGEEE